MQHLTQCKTLAKELMAEPETNAKVLVLTNTEKWLAELDDPNEKKLYTRACREGFLKGLIDDISDHTDKKKSSLKRQAKEIMDTTDMDEVFSVHCHVQQGLNKLDSREERALYSRAAMEGFLVHVLETFKEHGYLRFNKKARKAATEQDPK